MVSDNPATGDLRFITVRIIDDDDYEGDHTFMMMITTSSPEITVGGSASITIQDNDGITSNVYIDIIMTDTYVVLF